MASASVCKILGRNLFALAVAGLALASGCSAQGAPDHETQVGVIGHTSSLNQLPDCAAVDVDSTFAAMPSEIDGFYIVLDGMREVCATDLDGLQTLAFRVDVTLDPNNYAASDPMPGRNGDPTASDPMPGRNGDPAASDPMPGRGGDPAATTSLSGRPAVARILRRASQQQ